MSLHNFRLENTLLHSNKYNDPSIYQYSNLYDTQKYTKNVKESTTRRKQVVVSAYERCYLATNIA